MRAIVVIDNGYDPILCDLVIRSVIFTVNSYYLLSETIILFIDTILLLIRLLSLYCLYILFSSFVAVDRIVSCVSFII